VSVEVEDDSGRPRSERDIRAAINFVSAEMVANPMHMGAHDTGPAVIHYLTIRDALTELLALRVFLEKQGLK
jgi:hypothetical protein